MEFRLKTKFGFYGFYGFFFGFYAMALFSRVYGIWAFQKIYYFGTTSHTFVPIIHQLVQGVMGTHSGPLSPKILFFYFFIFFIRNCINCENFIEKYQKLTFLSNFLYFCASFFRLKIAYFW